MFRIFPFFERWTCQTDATARANQNHEQSAGRGVLSKVVLGNFVLALVLRAIDERNAFRLREATDPTTEPSRHPDEVGVVQRFV